MSKRYVIGADIGGSHICAAVVDVEKYTILEDTFISEHVDNTQSKAGIIKQWSEVFNKVLDKKENGVIGLACAIPGPFNYSEGIAKYPEGFKFSELNGVKIEDELSPLLASETTLPIKFLNDATSFAVGVARSNPTIKDKRTLCITLGTGLGAGFVDKRLPVLSGPTVPPNGCLWNLEWDEGMADDYFSTRGIIKLYADLGGEKIVGAKELADRIDTDPLAVKTFEVFGENLAQFLTPYLKTFKADALVMGGSISKAFSFFGPSCVAKLEANGVQLEVLVSNIMEKGAILGCTCVFEQDFMETIGNDLPKI
ncbi:ROK family protein [Flagellimonas nanhaiensis]|uniref:ROK family protein n=1 Tax=Flagellimonas nanhaiensis TaxID=2292706 RepID=A0A371JSY7_9FLAO|nr:ROK family protein [Allomuricauda nanhaiensis]RDY60869.1 ROK family protein [Allomuricauda nanhaiensis]